MDNLITQQGYFYAKIAFTLANAEAVRSGSIRGIILSQYGNETTIIRTHLRSPYPIAIVIRIGNEDSVLAIDEKGFDANCIQYFIYEKTNYPTYQHFTPDPYQSCLVRNRLDTNDEPWFIAVCNGYNDGDNPTFFGLDPEMVYDCLPLDPDTQQMEGRRISLQEYIEETFSKAKF